MLELSSARLSRDSVPGFNGFDRVLERFHQNSLPNGSDHQAEQPSFEVFAISYGNQVNISQTVGTAREGVGVSRCASPRIGVGRTEDDVIGIGPVVVQAFPDAARAFRDIGVRRTAAMDLHVLVGAVAKEL